MFFNTGESITTLLQVSAYLVALSSKAKSCGMFFTIVKDSYPPIKCENKMVHDILICTSKRHIIFKVQMNIAAEIIGNIKASKHSIFILLIYMAKVKHDLYIHH